MFDKVTQTSDFVSRVSEAIPFGMKVFRYSRRTL